MLSMCHAFVNGVYHFFIPEKPDPSKDYYVARGKLTVILEARSKELAIQYFALKNSKDRFVRVSALFGATLGTFFYHKGFWDHNLLLSAAVLPLSFGIYKLGSFFEEMHYGKRMKQVCEQIKDLNRGEVPFSEFLVRPQQFLNRDHDRSMVIWL